MSIGPSRTCWSSPPTRSRMTNEAAASRAKVTSGWTDVSSWHREHPDEMFGPSDPWTRHESYRRHAPPESAEPPVRHNSVQEETMSEPSHVRIRLEIGLLAILMALCGYGLFHWYAVLFGW